MNNTLKSIFLLLPLATGSVISVTGEPLATDINPASLYYQSFLLTPDLTQADRDFVYANEWRGQKLPERFGEVVSRYDNQFKLVRQAAQSTVPCDWGIDLSSGPATLLPHLARCKAIAQAARLRTMWFLQNRQEVEARDDLLAGLAVGRNSARDGLLISTLVQIAVENIVCSTVAENFYQFSPETLKQLADGFAAAPTRGTMAACIPTEKSSFLDWLVDKIVVLQKENPGSDSKAMAGIRDLVASFQGADEGQNHQDQPSLWEQVTKAAGGTSEGVVKLLRDEETLYQRLAAILALPQSEYESQAKQFSAEIEKSTNPFVNLSFPAFEKARQKEFAILAELAMVQAAVEYKLNGEPGLKSVRDPFAQDAFAFRRFVFDGVDRGFELKSAYAERGFPEVLIFVDKEGVPFSVTGNSAGHRALPKSHAAK